MATTEPLNRLKESGADLLKTLGDEALGTVRDKMSDVTDKLEGVANGSPIGSAALRATSAKAEGKSPAGGAVKGLFSGLKEKLTGGGGGGGADKATKAMNIVESIDVGVPIRVAYNQWTQFGEFPSFMKKVESVEAAEDNKLNWKAQVFWSHRTWEATIQKQVPDECIVWRSKGPKGHVDGAVTFHELGPNLTRILLILEYYPQGLFERTGNLWRAQGRRARLEFKHFRRHIMTRTILNPDEVEGWRGRIEDGEVVQTHDDALEEEQQAQAEGAEGEETAEYEEEGAEPGEGDEAAEYEEEGAEPGEGDEAAEYEEEGAEPGEGDEAAEYEEGAEPVEGDETAEYEEEGAEEYEGGEEPADEEQDAVAEDEEASAEAEAPEGDEQVDEDVEEAGEETPPAEPSSPPSRRRRRPA